MTKKLFVGGLSWGTKDEQLKTAFESFGTVADAKVILDMDTGRSRGFGFVTFPDDDAATRAIGEMDGKELDGRMIRVNEATEKPRPARDRDGGPSRGPANRSGPAPRGAPGFRSENRPAATARGSKKRGRPGEGKGEDRFARRRNSQTKRGRPEFGEGGGDADDFGFSDDD